MSTAVFSVDKGHIGDVKAAIQSFSDRKDLETTSQYEFYRVQLHEHIVVVYTSGKVVVSGKTPENIELIIKNMLAKRRI